LQFLHQMINIFALLLNDALLKCVVAEVLFSIVAFKTLIFHKVVYDILDVWWDPKRLYYYICSPDSDSEISVKIGQYLTKLMRTKQSAPVFLGHPVY